MTDYKRLTTKREKGVFSSFDGAYKLLCKDCRLGNKLHCLPGTCQEILAERLGELEDKIESGEFVLKKEIVKDFAERVKFETIVENRLCVKEYDIGYNDGYSEAYYNFHKNIDELLKEYENDEDKS